MKITTYLIPLGIVAVAAIAGLLFLFSAQAVKASPATATSIGYVATTTTQFSVTTTARILATTTNTLGLGTSYTRVFASICNQSSNPVALNLDGDKAANGATGNVTVYIAAAAGYSACYEINDRNQYSGSVTASSTSQAATQVTVKDYVQ